MEILFQQRNFNLFEHADKISFYSRVIFLLLSYNTISGKEIKRKDFRI